MQSYTSEFHLFLFDIEALIVQLLSDELNATSEQQRLEESQSGADTSADGQKAAADAVSGMYAKNSLVFRPPGINSMVSSGLAALLAQKQARQTTANAAAKGRARAPTAAHVLDDQALEKVAKTPSPSGVPGRLLHGLRKSASGFFYGGGGDKSDGASNNAIPNGGAGGGLTVSIGDEQSSQANDLLSPCQAMNSLETARLLVSCLHAWGLDAGIDALCVEKLGLRPPQPFSLCFAALSRERYLCLFLPGWATPSEQTRALARQASTPRMSSPPALAPSASPLQSPNAAPLLVEPERLRDAATQQRRRELELARWQLSSSITTQHLISITALANTMLSLSRLILPPPDMSHSVSVDSQLRHALATATHLREEKPSGQRDLVRAVQQATPVRKKAPTDSSQPQPKRSSASAPFTSYFARDLTSEVEYNVYDDEQMEIQIAFRQVNSYEFKISSTRH